MFSFSYLLFSHMLFQPFSLSLSCSHLLDIQPPLYPFCLLSVSKTAHGPTTSANCLFLFAVQLSFLLSSSPFRCPALFLAVHWSSLSFPLSSTPSHYPDLFHAVQLSFTLSNSPSRGPALVPAIQLSFPISSSQSLFPALIPAVQLSFPLSSLFFVLFCPCC